MIERTLVLIKPDGVQRALIGKILERFENAGLKIVGMKMVWADKKFAEKHYTEDLAIRRGKEVRDVMVNFITQGPVVAIALEGVEAIEVVRKLVGSTEPKVALPGTIRGDFTHHSIAHANELKKAISNIIHASSDKKDAENELKLWFDKKELHSYKTVHDIYVF
ncbi:MAG TPA: nucleoside-diphosphate kinase [Candidatus Nanoarchaeia archaeon]|nr:nucleoside-diphosphate kinase [Candidatus Nanoarchaeia archaeon]